MWGLLESWLNTWFLAARAAQYLHMGLSHHYEFRAINAASGQITSNFLTHASCRLYEIRQPPTSLCTTSNFLFQPPTSSWSPWTSWSPWSSWLQWSWQNKTGQDGTGRDGTGNLWLAAFAILAMFFIFKQFLTILGILSLHAGKATILTSKRISPVFIDAGARGLRGASGQLSTASAHFFVMASLIQSDLNSSFCSTTVWLHWFEAFSMACQ